MSLRSHYKQRELFFTYPRKKLKTVVFTTLFLMLFTQGLPSVTAQTYSHDGYRWYEVEVSIFTNPLIPIAFDEELDQSKLNLRYPENLRELDSASESIHLDFTLSEPDAIVPGSTQDRFLAQQGFELEPRFLIEAPKTEYLAEFSPANESFRLQDMDNDPYIELSTTYETFTRHNQRLENSPNHRLLYHSTWRQPVQNRSQSQSISITGGDKFDEHFELEGSLTISFNINRIDIETNLWLLEFVAGSRFNSSDKFLDQSVIPALPFDVSESQLEEGDLEQALSSPRENRLSLLRNGDSTPSRLFDLQGLHRMQETRSMISGNLHYLDHPAFGLLVEVRPYQLPLDNEQESVNDFE